MMRVGLLGASRIAPDAIIAPAARRDDVTVVAIAARDGERARQYADTHGIAQAVEGYDALVEREDIDVIYCGLPPSQHLQICLTALRAGKALLIEKPFAMDADAARQIVGLAGASNALEGFHYRFHSQFERAIAIVRGGSIGKVVRMEGVFHAQILRHGSEYRWRAECGGGAMMDLGCYVLHAFRTLMGAEPRVATVSGHFKQGVDVSLCAELLFDEVPATLTCSMAARREDRLTIEGEKGVLHVENFVAPQHGGRLRLVREGQDHAEPASGPTSYAAQLEHVVQVWRGAAKPLTGGQDAVANMVVIDACLQMARRSQIASPSTVHPDPN